MMAPVNRFYRRQRSEVTLVAGSTLLHDKYGVVHTCHRWPDPGGTALIGQSLLDATGEMPQMKVERTTRRQRVVDRNLSLFARIDATTAAGWTKSRAAVVLGRRHPPTQDTATTAKPQDSVHRLDLTDSTDPPGTLATASPAAPHGPPAPRVGVAA